MIRSALKNIIHSFDIYKSCQNILKQTFSLFDMLSKVNQELVLLDTKNYKIINKEIII